MERTPKGRLRNPAGTQQPSTRQHAARLRQGPQFRCRSGEGGFRRRSAGGAGLRGRRLWARRASAQSWAREPTRWDGGGRRGRLFPFRCLRALHPGHVLHWPLGPQAHAEDTERGQHPVPAFSHHGCQAKIIQTKSTQRLSFSLTIATLLSSTSWSIYGFRLRDPYITVPNLPGILTSLIRLGLFCKYPAEHDRKYRLLQT
ncbi:sugar transporter SWEET1 isoform X4 [Peromyscus californicus insignis]|uniref:sugar transporter SWEET1 isoform X4 n=1 Tax=Peromyscus californicus insignis TaxID=564181 RepID=UPI0022A7ABB0|nr:sugar transporter SWEET1 isoform X4 [Peromyscus californicus insignis]